MLGQNNPSATGKNENGPDNLVNKDEIVSYVKDAFAYAHKAMATLTNDNLMQETADPFDPQGQKHPGRFRQHHVLAHLRSLRPDGGVRADERRDPARQPVRRAAYTRTVNAFSVRCTGRYSVSRSTGVLPASRISRSSSPRRSDCETVEPASW